MDEAQLLDALNTDHPANAACRDAIESGGRVSIAAGRVPVEHLVRIYSYRVRHLAELGAKTVGSKDVIERLRTADGSVQIASVETADRHFVIVVDDRERVVSSWGVPATHRGDDEPASLRKQHRQRQCSPLHPERAAARRGVRHHWCL